MDCWLLCCTWHCHKDCLQQSLRTQTFSEVGRGLVLQHKYTTASHNNHNKLKAGLHQLHTTGETPANWPTSHGTSLEHKTRKLQNRYIHWRRKANWPAIHNYDTHQLVKFNTHTNHALATKCTHTVLCSARLYSHTVVTRSSAVAERPRNTSCHWIFC